MELKYLDYLKELRKKLIQQAEALLQNSEEQSDEAARIAEHLNIVNKQIASLEEYFRQREQGLEPRISDFIETYSLTQFAESTIPASALFDEHSTFVDFLTWFYEELPFLADKHLIVVSENKAVPFGHIPLNNRVILNHDKKCLQVHLTYPDTGDLGEIILPNLNLYQMLTVSPKEMEEHIMSLDYGDVYAEY